MNATPQSILKIKQLYPEFNGKYRDIADYIIRRPEQIFQLRVREFARNCNCDDAQVVRFCQKLGLKGFQELKSAIAADFIPVKLSVPVRDTGGVFDQVRRDFIQNYSQVMNDTAALFDEENISAAVDAVFRAKRIHLAGFASSGIVAQDFQVKLYRMGFNAFYSPDQELAKMYSALLEADDVLIAVSFSGENASVCSEAKIAREHGAMVIGITNYPKSPLGELCDRLLLTASEENTFRLGAMGSRFAQLLIVDFLSLHIALRDVKRTEDSVIRAHGAIYNEPKHQ